MLSPSELQLLHAYREFLAECSSWRAIIYLNLIHAVLCILEAQGIRVGLDLHSYSL